MLILSTEQSFNQYLFFYSSSTPLKGYILNNQKKVESFYLSKGKNISFSSFITGFWDNTVYSNHTEFHIESLSIEESDFKLIDYHLNMFDQNSHEKIQYIENNKIKVGIDLNLGGSISYFKNKFSPNNLDNLLNNHDTGRLIQQSYYGIGQPPYESGTFMNQNWCYNPVQGGDKENNKSKLIAFHKDKNSISIKCQPMDWGHNGCITPAYMENIYTLDEDCLRIDNSFTDFSGYSHQIHNQELPAFYTISYLSDFVTYQGEHPWNEDKLTTIDDLPFWANNWDKCTFNMNSNNSEYWASFCDKNGFGIGIFVPNITTWIAGRHRFNNSTDPSDSATNYIAAVKAMKIKSYKTLSYSYYICSGSITQIRKRFFEKKDIINNELLSTY